MLTAKSPNLHPCLSTFHLLLMPRTSAKRRNLYNTHRYLSPLQLPQSHLDKAPPRAQPHAVIIEQRQHLALLVGQSREQRCQHQVQIREIKVERLGAGRHNGESRCKVLQ